MDYLLANYILEDLEIEFDGFSRDGLTTRWALDIKNEARSKGMTHQELWFWKLYDKLSEEQQSYIDREIALLRVDDDKCLNIHWGMLHKNALTFYPE